IAVLLGYPGSRGAIEAILDGRSARRVLRDLSDRYLITITSGEEGKLYGQHAIVREFFYEALNKRERRQMHGRAAEYYRDEEPDLLLAARHYLEAGDQEPAADLITTDTHVFINKGQASQLNQLLNRFQPEELDILRWISINIVGGEVKTFLGNIEPAQNQFELTLSLLADMPHTKESEALKAHACLGLGELLEYKDPQRALTWVKQGLTENKNLPTKTKASLLIMRGTLQMHLGEYEIARQNIELGLSLLDVNDSSERCQALNSLSGICHYLGLTEQGITYSHEALAISRNTYSLFQEASILSNLAIHKHVGGNWTEAIAIFKAALEIAKKIGYKLDIAGFQLNLGAAYINTGEYDEARIHLLEASRVANDIGDEITCGLSYYRLAEVDVKKNDLTSAENHLVSAQKLAEDMDGVDQLPAIYSLFTEISLRQKNLNQAIIYAERAYESALALDDPFEIGIAHRARGLVATDSEDCEKAVTHYQESFELLVNLDPYEAAKTQLELGRIKLQTNDVKGGIEIIEKARNVF
ncbi:MAG: tetratricopeptide repeat protein, partial [Anaerolineae bacterium]|nr:tetratricopeptide repeat protein [Anaerolineae bacterium]